MKRWKPKFLPFKGNAWGRRGNNNASDWSSERWRRLVCWDHWEVVPWSKINLLLQIVVCSYKDHRVSLGEHGAASCLDRGHTPD